MAPKRGHASKASASAKKAKVSVEDPLAAVFAALSESKHTATECDLLRSALPHCFAEAAETRHSFQTRVLDTTASILNGLEEAARTGFKDAETASANAKAQAATAKANFDGAQLLANSKKAESDAKNAEVDKLIADVNAAKAALQGEVEKKDAHLASKATLIAAQEAFKKLMSDAWEPLKTGGFSAKEWRQRDKALNELVKSLKPLSLQASLVDALQKSLKQKPEDRSTFAKTSLTFAEEAFGKHQAHQAQLIADAGPEEAACEKAIAEAEAKLAAIQAEHSKHDKENDELQNVWVELESKAFEAKNAASKLDSEVEEAEAEVEAHKENLDGAIKVSAAFATLRDPPPPAAEQPAEEAADEPVPMDAEPEAVAAA
jgi:hypothetical protein